MFTTKQHTALHETIGRYGMSEEKFHFAPDGAQLLIIYKPQEFYFRFVSSQPPVAPSVVFLYSTPDRSGAALNAKQAVRSTARTWDEVLSSFEGWLEWLSEEYEGPEDSRSKVEKLSQRWDKVVDSLMADKKLQQAPTSALTHLHPAVQQAVTSRFSSGHYSDAVEKACLALETEVRKRANQPKDLGGTDLMNRVFSQANPILALSADRGEREGYMFLFRGMWQALRSHHAHNDTAIEPARALEWLGFISALFYKLDEAKHIINL